MFLCRRGSFKELSSKHLNVSLRRLLIPSKGGIYYFLYGTLNLRPLKQNLIRHMTIQNYVTGKYRENTVALVKLKMSAETACSIPLIFLYLSVAGKSCW